MEFGATCTVVPLYGIFKDKVCTTRINKEKKFKIKFQVLLKFTQILPDYMYDVCVYDITFEMSIQIELDCKYNVATRFLTMELLLIILQGSAGPMSKDNLTFTAK